MTVNDLNSEIPGEDHHFDRGQASSPLAAAWNDISAGARNWQTWGLLGWHDVRQRYRRSKIGPFWLTISTGVTVGALGLVYGHLFGMDMSTYLPFLTAGMIIWSLISTVLVESCNAFVEARNIIRESPMPLSLHLYRGIWRSIIIFAHNLVIYVLVLLLFHVPLTWATLLIVPGFLALTLNLIWITIFLGTVCTRFRDVPQIVASLVQLCFFITPIIWHSGQQRGLAWLLNGNPFYHTIELVRAPMLGQAPELYSWVFVAGMIVVGSVITLAAYAANRSRLPYWV